MSRTLSRRRFLAVSGATVAGAALLSGCGDDPPATAGSPLERARADGLRLGFSGGAPFSILQPDGSFSGAAPELARAVLARLGVTKLTGTKIEFAGLIPALLADRIDMIASATNITPERCQQVTFARPFLVTLNTFATAKGSDVRVSTFADIARTGSGLGVIAGSVDVEQAKKSGVAAAKVVPFPDVTAALAGLRDGRVGAVVASVVQLRYTAARTGALQQLDFSPAFTPVVDGKPAVAAAGMVLRKQDQSLADEFSRVQQELMAGGEAVRVMAPFEVTPESVSQASALTVPQLCAGT